MAVARALRWAGALIMAAAVPALAFAALQLNLRTFVTALWVTGLHVLLLGLPAGLVYRRWAWGQPTVAVAGGFFIGALPIGSVMVLVGDRPTSVGLLATNLGILATCGGLGALGAAAFWLTMKSTGGFR